MGDNAFFRFFGFLTLPFRFPLAVVTSAFAVPFLAAVNITAVTVGTVATKNFLKSDSRNIDPDAFGIMVFTKAAYRGLVKFGTYPMPEFIDMAKSDNFIDSINSSALKALGVENNAKSDIAGSEKKSNEFDVASTEKRTQNEKVNLSDRNPNATANPSVKPVSAKVLDKESAKNKDNQNQI